MGGTPGDAGVVDLVSQPIFETAGQDVLWAVGEPAKLLGVLSHLSPSLADGLDVVSSFAVGQGGPQIACGTLL